MKRFNLTTILAPAIVMLSCFGGLLLGRRTFVFRDSGHYYYPLWSWLTRQWQQGEFPLWNAYENGGAPLAADPTASLFYPGKLLFLLPLGPDVTYNLFLLAHFVLAFWLTWRAARQFGLDSPAATLAGLSYTFSGPVLIQHANAPYLIGAAWLPLALSASYALLRERRWRHALHWAFAVAMILLGGDVQSAYHMLLVLMLTWWLVPAAAATPKAQSAGWYRRPIVLIGGAAALAGGMAAIQILPARDWTKQTVRATYDSPRNLYEVATHLSRGQPVGQPPVSMPRAAHGLFSTPIERSHHAASYNFSVGPWRWPELLWPNVSGRMYPTNLRWLAVVPAEGRVWAPSLYQGVLPLLLALSVMRFRRGKAPWKWLSWLAILALLSALGWYGLGWIVHEIDHAWRGGGAGEPAIGPQVGGLYWFYSTVLPGYTYFRYPAKWFTIASLAISLLAAHGLQVNLRRVTRRARRLLLATLGLTLLGLLGVTLFRSSWLSLVSGVEADRYFGPLMADDAWFEVLHAGLHTLLVVGLGYALLSWRRVAGWLPLASTLVLLTALDLAVAQSWLAPTAPAELWQSPSSIADEIGSRPDQQPPRVYRSRSPGLLPPVWARQPSPRRLVEGMIWERDTLHPKHYLAAGIGSIQVSTAMSSYDHAVWLSLARQQAEVEGKQPDYAELSVTHLILPVRKEQEEGEKSVRLEKYPQVRLLPTEAPQPRVRLARQVTELPPLADRSAGTIIERTREVMRLMATGKTVVQGNGREASERLNSIAAGPIHASEQVKLVKETANRLEFEVQLSQPALLVLADTFTTDWHAQLGAGEQARQLEVYRVNRLFRGVVVPAGVHRVTMSYWPSSLGWGLSISVVSWLLMFAGVGLANGCRAGHRHLVARQSL